MSDGSCSEDLRVCLTGDTSHRGFVQEDNGYLPATVAGNDPIFRYI